MDKQLLEKFIKGACSAEEAARVQHWMDRHPEQLEAWMQEIWNEEVTVSMPAAMEETVTANLPGLGKKPSKTNHRRFYWAAAAAIIITVGAWWMNAAPGRKATAIVSLKAPAGSPLRYVLPDQSIVWLKANTRLQLDTQVYKQSERRITLLSGEAFFEVQKDKVHPFIVRHGAVNTRVLGTSFSVQAASGDSVLQVTVATGKVEVSHGKEVLDVLLPGKQISVQPQTGAFTEQEVPVWMASLWKETSIQLTNARFDELALAMEKIYGVTLQAAGGHIRNRSYNIRLDKNMPVEQVIEVLALLNHNRYKKMHHSTFLLY